MRKVRNHSQIILLVIAHLLHAHVGAFNRGTLTDTQVFNGAAASLDPSAKTSMVWVGEEASVGDFLNPKGRLRVCTDRVVC